MRRGLLLIALVPLFVVAACGGGSSKATPKCPAGEWVPTEESLRSIMGVTSAPTAKVSGALALSLTSDGGVAYAFQELSADSGSQSNISIDGTVSGTYTKTDTALTIKPTTSDLNISVNGKPLASDELAATNARLESGIAGASPYTCSGNTLTITGANDGKTTIWTRA